MRTLLNTAAAKAQLRLAYITAHAAEASLVLITGAYFVLLYVVRVLFFERDQQK